MMFKNKSEELTQLSNGTSKVKSKLIIYSRRQWIVFSTFWCINWCSGMCYSILAPFYPREADSRGVTSSIYGFVFGVFELVIFIVSPLYGKYIKLIGPKFMLNAGNFVMGICNILFGCLVKIRDRTSFVAFSFIIRIAEALGGAGILTASYAIVAQEFPNNIATTFSILETAYALGTITAPTIGGLLFELQGFLLPFLAVGITLLVATVITYFALPELELDDHKSPSFVKFMLIPGIAISYYAIVVTSFSLAFVFALLEPQLRQFHLSPAEVGIILVIGGITYGLTAGIWGFVADKYIHPKLLCGVSGIFISVAFFLIGPAPFLPIKPSLWLIILALVLHGIGAAGEYVTAFLDSIQEAVRCGYPNNIETYALVSGSWASGLALGSFIGSSVSGILNDIIGFRGSSLVVVVLHLLVIVLCFGYHFYEKRKTKLMTDENKAIFPNDLKEIAVVLLNGSPIKNNKIILKDSSLKLEKLTTENKNGILINGFAIELESLDLSH